MTLRPKDDRCEICGRPVKRSLSRETVEVGRHLFTAQMPIQTCGSCGWITNLLEGRGELMLRAAAEFVRAGDFSGTAIRQMRLVLGLRAEDLAKLLDVRPETISRWETGKWAINRTAAATLGTMILDRLESVERTLMVLKALQSPKRVRNKVDFGTITGAPQ